ncbi:MAG: YceI family protein [Candidatus Sericytochromatia bacterium]|nr:YceI family protein [Candidatus Sericytochromatia bacterium]
MHRTRFTLVSAGLLVSLAASAATTYGLSLRRGTRVGFATTVSALGLESPVNGWSQAVTGPTIPWSVDQTRLERPATFTLPTSSLSTGLALRDRDIQQILEARRFPTIRFDLQKIDGLNAAEVASGKGDFHVGGSLTAHGLAQPVRLACTFVRQAGTIQIKGRTTVTWRDFGLTVPTAMGGTVRAKDSLDLLLESTWDLDRLPIH